jgi:hypothetical protein
VQYTASGLHAAANTIAKRTAAIAEVILTTEALVVRIPTTQATVVRIQMDVPIRLEESAQSTTIIPGVIPAAATSLRRHRQGVLVRQHVRSTLATTIVAGSAALRHLLLHLQEATRHQREVMIQEQEAAAATVHPVVAAAGHTHGLLAETKR